MPDAPPENQPPEIGGEPQTFDYAEPAEVFTRAGMVAPPADGSQAETGAVRTPRRKAITYKRFPSGAEAVRYAIEELPPAHLPASVLVLNGDRYEGAAIKALYDNADYPLPRRAPRKPRRPRPSE